MKNFTKLKEYYTKKYSLKEGLIDYIFGKILVSKLKNDSNFISLAKQLDTDLQKLRDKVEDMKRRGEEIPPSAKRLLNIKD